MASLPFPRFLGWETIVPPAPCGQLTRSCRDGDCRWQGFRLKAACDGESSTRQLCKFARPRLRWRIRPVAPVLARSRRIERFAPLDLGKWRESRVLNGFPGGEANNSRDCWLVARRGARAVVQCSLFSPRGPPARGSIVHNAPFSPRQPQVSGPVVHNTLFSPP